MGKVLGTIGKILFVAAATIFTAGGLGIVTLVAGEGFALAATIAGIVGSVAGAVGGALQASKLKRMEDTDQSLRGRSFVDPNSPGDFVWGQTAVHDILVYEAAGSTVDRTSTVFAHAWHEIDSYVSMTVNGLDVVTFTGDLADAPYSGVLEWHRADGTQVAALSLAVGGWGATDIFLGVAHSSLEWDLGNAQTQVTNGVPHNILIEVKGAKLYDPRLDPTYGSGTQDFDSQANWIWEAGNPALVALRYLIGEFSAGGDLIWGVGEAEADIDMASFITAADVADEAIGGESTPRYRIEGSFPTTGDHQGFWALWEQNTGGRIFRSKGKRTCWLPSDDLTSVQTFTDADIIGSVGVTAAYGADVEGMSNTVRGRFTDPAALYEGVPYTEIEEASYVTEDGERVVLELDLPWVQTKEVAQRVARMAVRRTRFPKVFVFATGWPGMGRAPLDVVTLNCQETDNTAQLCRITDKRMTTDGIYILTLRQESAVIYSELTVAAAMTSVAPPATVGALAPLHGANNTLANQFGSFVIWHFLNTLDSYTGSSNTLTAQTTSLKIESTGSDPQLISPVSQSINGAHFFIVRIRIKRLAGSGWDGTMFYTTSGHGFSASFEKSIADTTVTDQWVVLEFDMSNLSVGGTDWITNTITQIRFDFGDSATDDFEVDYVTVGALQGHGGAQAPVQNLAVLGGGLTTATPPAVIHRAAVDDVMFSANADFDIFEGSNKRRATHSMIPWLGADADSFTYSPTFGALPRVIFNAGGLHYGGSALSTTKKQYPIRTAVSHTSSGFTMKAELAEINTGTITPRTLNCNVPTTGVSRETPAKGINDTTTTSTKDDIYHLNYTITVTGFSSGGEDFPGIADVEFWENSTGSYIRRAVKRHTSQDGTTPDDFTDSINFILNGIDTADKFKIVVVRISAGTSTAVIKTATTPTVTYNTEDATAALEIAATEAGVADIPGQIFHNEDTGQVN